MRQLPVLPPTGGDHGASLAQKRDELLRLGVAEPGRLREAMRVLALRCVTETLRLTGVPVSLSEVEEASALGDTSASAEQALILGQLRALEAMRKEADSHRSMGAPLIREVHRLSSPPGGGRFRRRPATPRFSTVRPSPAHRVSSQVDNLVEWLKAESVRSLRMPERAALGLARLLEIAPFARANFRTAHLLMNFFAFEEDYAPFFLRSDDAEGVREEIERAFRFDTLPLVVRLARAQSASLDYCLRAVRDGVTG